MGTSPGEHQPMLGSQGQVPPDHFQALYCFLPHWFLAVHFLKERSFAFRGPSSST